MELQELRQAKIDLLDAVWELAHEPVPDLEAVKAKIESFFKELENPNGKDEQAGR